MTVDTSCIVKNKDGNVVGRIEYNVFIKDVYGNKHMLRKPVAWAIDCDVFNRVIVPLCHSIQIKDRDSGHTYICKVGTFREKRGVLNRKHNNQYYLELVHWIVE